MSYSTVSRQITVTADDARRTISQPTFNGKDITLRLEKITVWSDGTVHVWAVQMTKTGRPYKSGMGITYTLASSRFDYTADMFALVRELLASEAISA